MTRVLAAAAVAGAWWAWWPVPPPGADPVVDLIARHSPRVHAAIRTWHYREPRALDHRAGPDGAGAVGDTA